MCFLKLSRPVANLEVLVAALGRVPQCCQNVSIRLPSLHSIPMSDPCVGIAEVAPPNEPQWISTTDVVSLRSHDAPGGCPPPHLCGTALTEQRPLDWGRLGQRQGALRRVLL